MAGIGYKSKQSGAKQYFKSSRLKSLL